MAQLLDVFFQALDFLLAFVFFRTVQGRGSGFVLSFGAHSGTVRTEGWPQISRMASSNSGELFTRCCACNNATAPSGEHNSNTTAQGPGAAVDETSHLSRASSLIPHISIRTPSTLEPPASGISSSRPASRPENPGPPSPTRNQT